MFRLTLLGVQVALPQCVPHHVSDLLLCKEGAEAAVLHHCHSHLSSCPVYYVLISTKKHYIHRLIVLLLAPVILVIVVVVAHVALIVDINGGITHLWFLGVGITVFNGSRGRSRTGSGCTYLVCFV